MLQDYAQCKSQHKLVNLDYMEIDIILSLFFLGSCGSLKIHESPEWHPNRIIIWVIPWGLSVV